MPGYSEAAGAGDEGYTWVNLALQGAGLVKKGREAGVHRKRRPRRPWPGILLHLVGGPHPWFQDDRWYDLIEVLEDATGRAISLRVPRREGLVVGRTHDHLLGVGKPGVISSPLSLYLGK